MKPRESGGGEELSPSSEAEVLQQGGQLRLVGHADAAAVIPPTKALNNPFFISSPRQEVFPKNERFSRRKRL